ncbi:MAG TPA: hypoxanthine phosphoribosyltransferase [Chitinophagales bacterium]|jgi:hypoxanthine phosphoribosyltransferase|nr:hypoxanthine phosphoribosyltransferase [Chitinophagales bacterium]HQG38520.1 hypoxanthine phosphoribosyltransferase [Chitinophagales bacterium]
MKTIKIKGSTFNEFLTEAQIQSRIDEIVTELSERYHDKHPVFVVVLRGAFIFASDILKKFNFPCEIEFVKLTSYTGMQSTGKINMVLSLKEEIVKGRDIIVVEDIVDSGLTMDFFIQYLHGLSPRSLSLITFLFKPENLQKEVKIDLAGFTIPDLFVVGYGLDYDGEGRNLSAVYQLAT